MHPRVKEALEQIDAAVFNGDTFDDADAKAELVSYLRRWTKRLRLKAAITRKDEPERPEWTVTEDARGTVMTHRDAKPYADGVIGCCCGNCWICSGGSL